MSAEMNKTSSRRIIEDIFSKGKLSLIQEVCLPNYLVHDPTVPTGDVRGHDGFTQYVNLYRTAFPDLNITVEDQVAQGDQVVTRWTAHGTHRGDFMGIAPTGKKATVTGITLDRYVNGKLAESWGNYDSLGLLQQLGVVPAMAQTETRTRARH